MFQASSSHGCASASSSPITLYSSPSLSLSHKLSSVSQTHYPQQRLLFSKINSNENGAFHLPNLSISSSSSTTTAATRRRPTESDGNDRISSSDYLIRSLDLSPEVITKNSKRKPFQISSISRADSVLALFRDYGFTDSQISTIFVSCSVLLEYLPTKLRLKLDFFAQNGVAGDSLLRLLTAYPHVLLVSLERRIAPCFDFLADFFGNRQAIFSFVSLRHGLKLVDRFRPSVPQNARSLRLRGVPDSSIVEAMVQSRTRPSMLSDTDAFEAGLEEVEKMGFQPSSTLFVHGLCGMMRASKGKWVSLVKLFKRFGCSEEEFLALFLKQPTLITRKEKNLEEKMTFLLHKVGWTYSDLAKYPIVLLMSYEQRILPRFAVLELLCSRGLVKKTSLGNAFQLSEARFLNKYVDKYREKLPHLLEVYRSNFR